MYAQAWNDFDGGPSVTGSAVHRRAKEQLELQAGATRVAAQINLGGSMGREDDGDGAKGRGQGRGDRGLRDGEAVVCPPPRK